MHQSRYNQNNIHFIHKIPSDIKTFQSLNLKSLKIISYQVHL